MTTFGNILLALTMLLGALAFGLTASLLNHRDSWQKSVQTAREKYEDVTVRLAEKRKEINSQYTELSRASVGWGQVWDNVRTQLFNPQAGIIQVGIGSSAGLTREGVDGSLMPTIFAFQPDQNSGGMIYVGQFKAMEINANNATLRLMRTPLPGEVNTWQPGNWRLRSEMPPGQVNRFDELAIQFAVAEEMTIERLQNLNVQQELLTEAISQLDQRIAELNGLTANQKNATELLKKGLVSTILEEEQARNQELAVLEQLREELFAKYNQILDLAKENLELESKLPADETVTNAPAIKQTASADNDI